MFTDKGTFRISGDVPSWASELLSISGIACLNASTRFLARPGHFARGPKGYHYRRPRYTISNVLSSLTSAGIRICRWVWDHPPSPKRSPHCSALPIPSGQCLVSEPSDLCAITRYVGLTLSGSSGGRSFGRRVHRRVHSLQRRRSSDGCRWR